MCGCVVAHSQCVKIKSASAGCSACDGRRRAKVEARVFVASAITPGARGVTQAGELVEKSAACVLFTLPILDAGPVQIPGAAVGRTRPVGQTRVAIASSTFRVQIETTRGC